MLLEKLNATKPVLADSTTIADLTADENITNSGELEKSQAWIRIIMDHINKQEYF